MEQQFAYCGKLLLLYFSQLDKLLMLALLLCLTGLPLLAAVGQDLARSRGRSAYDKCARQLGQLGGRLGLVAGIAGGIALAVQYESLLALDINNLAARENFVLLLMAGGWLCVLFSALLNRLYAGLWQRPRMSLRLHQLLALLAALAAAAALYAALAYLHARGVVSAPADSRALLLPDAELFWTALGYTPLAALALAGGYGALWLLLRRNADDYGRDHYNLVIPWCAGWARNAWLLLWLLVAIRTGRRIFQLHEAAGGSLDWSRFAPDAAGLFVFLLPGLLWLGLSRSAAPLRAKIALSLAPLWATGCLFLLDMGG